MATTTKSMINIARKILTSREVTIQPGAVATLFFPSSTVDDYRQLTWTLDTLNNDARVYSDLIVTGGFGRITARNMSDTAFTGTIAIEALYYPYLGIAYA